MASEGSRERMTYQEAANYLRISLATIDRMVPGWRDLFGLDSRTTIVPDPGPGRVYPSPQHSWWQISENVDQALDLSVAWCGDGLY